MPTAIITGASQGIGKGTAEFFLTQDWNVINISRTKSDLTHSNLKNFSLNLGDKNWQDPFKLSMTNQFCQNEQICLIHNAACYKKDSIQNLSAQELRDVLEVNLVAPAILNTLLIPKMSKGSSILYIGSTLSEKAVQNAASYVISKHALLGMMRSTAQDLAGKNIHTLCICPGFTDTKMLKQHLQSDQSNLDIILSKICFHKLIKPEEIAKLTFYCALNPLLNGATIHANYGQIEH
ncbi:MAG TPA: SDR family oxidoreductase [Patescibacteria group bacterium]|nr:SDR family oxidoreductase [Gammaproteobacteria bacterium]HWA52523.1 SDR family oxidoreductase [Patescibacteria group bacterium]